jgi:hypothetical protein
MEKPVTSPLRVLLVHGCQLLHCRFEHFLWASGNGFLQKHDQQMVFQIANGLFPWGFSSC